MRNHYESEVGRFENAICPDVPTFREELPLVAEMLKDKKDDKILIYCTGGIRCEKAGAYLRKQGYNHVYQLEGGVINYAHAVKKEQLPSKFKGKNFVFDERLGERITDDVLCRSAISAAQRKRSPAQLRQRRLPCAHGAVRRLRHKRLGDCCSEECHRISHLTRRRAARTEARLTRLSRHKTWFSKKMRVRAPA
jgi:UPF0176 protein